VQEPGVLLLAEQSWHALVVLVKDGVLACARVVRLDDAAVGLHLLAVHPIHPHAPMS